MGRHRPRVRFLYRSSSKYLGSTLMRGFQLCSLMQDRLGDRYDFDIRPVPNLQKLRLEAAWIRLQPRDTIFILVKDVVDRFSPEGLMRLQSRAAGVALDHIDRHLHIMPKRGIDLHISASVSGVAAMKARITEVEGTADQIEGDTAQLLHGVDHRLRDLSQAKMDRFRPVYFGSPHVTTIPPRIAEELEVIDARNTRNMAAHFRSVAGYNLHYGIRKIVEYPHLRGRKPFTKGFTAAVLGANILTHADEDDALHLLGPDYPFMAASTDPDAILEIWEKAQRDFGGPNWLAAGKKMSELSERVSFEAQTMEFEAIIKRLLA